MSDIALVTGGSRGIGRAVCIELAKKGYEIWLNYHSNTDKAEETKKIIEDFNASCKLLKFDITDKTTVKEVLEKELKQLSEQNKKLSVLVNNAGIIRDKLFLWISDEEWEDVINTNLNGFYYVTKNVINHMKSNKKGSIVNISSLSGVIGNISQTNYSASKGAVIPATKALAKEVGRYNIRVNCVVPGLIKTDMLKDIEEDKSIKKQIPLKRFGEPEEIAKVVAFLTSKDASYITGSIINVTGGFY